MDDPFQNGTDVNTTLFPTPEPLYLQIDELSKEVEITANSLLFIMIVLSCMFLNLLLAKKHVHWLPESGFAMVLGFVLGSFLNLIGAYHEEEVVMFSPEVFFYALLPPIVFEAGWSLKRKNFFKNLGAICTFAIIGTGISTVIVGYGLYGFAAAGAIPGVSFGVVESLMFGALISATDPVATLAILGSSHVNADETLYALVFGESILNDAVAIVLFNTFRGYIGEGTHASVGQAFGTFCWISIISTLLGFAISLACAVGLKSFNFHGNDHYEFIVVLFFCLHFLLCCSNLGIVWNYVSFLLRHWHGTLCLLQHEFQGIQHHRDLS
jgi:sodium/hydrogen exchanger 8